MPDWLLIMALIAFPAIFLNIRLGQNGFLITALFGFALLSLQDRPKLAGVLIGLLCIKPHLALMFPIALFAIGAWQAIVVAAITVFLISALSYLVLGGDSWIGWLNSLDIARNILETYSFHWKFSPSIFSFLRLLDAPLPLAYGAQILLAIFAGIIVWRIWRTCPVASIRQGVLVLASLLASPYIFDYDLTLLAIPMILFVKASMQYGWLKGDREILILVWLTPLVMILIAVYTFIQIGPLFTLLMMAAFLRKQAKLVGKFGVDH